MNKIKKGFTLIELLVVVVILSILVAIALPKYLDTVDIANGKGAYDALQTIYAAQLRFRASHPNFAANFANLDVAFPAATANGAVLNFDGKFTITLAGNRAVTNGLENYQIIFDFANETKQCVVDSNANAAQGARVCKALGGRDTGGTTFDLM